MSTRHTPDAYYKAEDKVIRRPEWLEYDLRGAECVSLVT